MDTSYHSSRFENDVERLTAKYVEVWRGIPDTAPEFNRRFTQWQQRENERQLTQKLQKAPRSYGGYESLTDDDKAHLSLDVMKSIAGSSLLSREIQNDRFFVESEKVTRLFLNEGKAFDPTLSEGDLHQALRNLWVFNSIQLFSGKDILLTPSSFAYSLLYPYVDNGLDSADRTSKDKAGLVQWLSEWFKRNGCPPIDDLTRRIGLLLSMITEEYPREDHPKVYKSLLAILSAQQKSLLLQNDLSKLDDTDLLCITVEKGGTSVLADGYLAAGDLRESSADAVFEYGVVLQLIDDLQDLEEDRASGHETPFQKYSERGETENITRRLLQFAKRCATDLGNEDTSRSESIQQMIERSCTFLILDAVAQHHTHFSGHFLHRIEAAMPLRPAFLRELHNESESRRSRYSREAALSLH